MRVAIFASLGPPLGAACWVAIALAQGFTASVLLRDLPFFLLLSYFLGFAPALLVCQVDDYLSDKLAMWPRVAVTGVAGAVIIFAWMALIFGRNLEQVWAAFRYAHIGAIT